MADFEDKFSMHHEVCTNVRGAIELIVEQARLGIKHSYREMLGYTSQELIRQGYENGELERLTTGLQEYIEGLITPYALLTGTTGLPRFNITGTGNSTTEQSNS